MTESEDNNKDDDPENNSNGLDTDQQGACPIDEKKKSRRHRDPVLICKWITKSPNLAFGLTLFGHILFLMVTIMLAGIGYDILPIVFEQLPLNILDDVDYLRDKAFATAWDAEGVILRMAMKQDNDSAILSQYREAVELVFYTQDENGNALTKENLIAIQETEDWFTKSDDPYASDFAMRDDNGTLREPYSIIRLFDGSWADIDPMFNDPDYDNISQVLYRAYTLNETKAFLMAQLGKNSTITPTEARSKATKTLLYFGAPLEGYQNATDRKDEQITKIKTYMAKEMIPKLNYLYQVKIGDLDCLYFSGYLIEAYITRQIFMDMSLSLAATAFIIIFMCIQTGSLWCTGFAIMSIFTSFCCANMIYRVVLDFRYFGVFHVLAIFIILGIGADDVFVFLDSWKLTAHYSYPSLAHRLSDCYRKASMAMLFTSLTTAFAFIVSATSPFLGISAFGVFAGILVFVNYVSVITFFPCVVIMYHTHFEKYKCCCCCRQSPSVSLQNAIISGDLEAVHHRKHPVVKFFRGPYYNVVTHKVLRWFILAGFLVLLSVAFYFAFQIDMNEQEVKFLPEDTNFGKYISLRGKLFDEAASTDSPKINLVWGMKEQNLSSCHKTEAFCDGEVVWDTTFNLNSPESQIALMEFCDMLRNLSESETDSLRIFRDVVTGQPKIKCFIEDMEEFYTEEENRPRLSMFGPGRKFPPGTDLNMPFTREKAETIMDNMNHIYDKTKLSLSFQDYFVIMASYWLYNGFYPNVVEENQQTQFQKYDRYVLELQDLPNTQKFEFGDLEYYYGNRLGSIRIEVYTTLNRRMGFKEGLIVRDAWEEFMVEQMADMPTELQGGVQVSGELWHWLKVQDVLASTAVNGVIIGLCIAFPILIVATHNIIVGAMATLTISFITVSVLAVIPMAGWKLGVLESLNLVLVVGLAIDYVVHLAEGYARSAHVDRLGRVHDMLEEVGISVLSGAVSTLGSSMFLLLAEVLFFSQFGVFMFTTIGFSILFALGLFTTCLGVFGPQGDTGSLLPLYARIYECISQKSDRCSGNRI